MGVLFVCALSIVFSVTCACRIAPLPPREHRRRSATGQSVCTDAFGKVCELCCDGSCCENVTNGPPFPLDVVSVSFPIRFVLVVDDDNSKQWALDSDDVEAELDVLNHAFAAKTPFQFAPYGGNASSAVTVLRNTHLAKHCNTDMCYSAPTTCVFNTELLPAVGGNTSEALNVVVCDVAYDGESQFPWATVEGSPLQYIQLRYGAFAHKGDGTPRNGGRSLVHEVGHYLGLLHTFEGGCQGAGDYVDDTPPAAMAANPKHACVASDNELCGTGAPLPDVTNYMDYASDACMDHFTEGQVVRMQRAMAKYRPVLLQTVIASGNRTAESDGAALRDFARGLVLMAVFGGTMVLLVVCVHRSQRRSYGVLGEHGEVAAASALPRAPSWLKRHPRRVQLDHV